jgi:hypothetical protein
MMGLDALAEFPGTDDSKRPKECRRAASLDSNSNSPSWICPIRTRTTSLKINAEAHLEEISWSGRQ